MLSCFHSLGTLPDDSGVNGKPAYHILFRLGRNNEIHKEYLSTGY